MIAALRRLCLALPEAEERETWDTPTFRVRGKIFCLVAEGGTSCWVKAPRGSAELLVEAAPERFFRPPYLGGKGWVGVRLDADAEPAELEALVRRSYGLVAPKRLAAMAGG